MLSDKYETIINFRFKSIVRNFIVGYLYLFNRLFSCLLFSDLPISQVANKESYIIRGLSARSAQVTFD